MTYPVETPSLNREAFAALMGAQRSSVVFDGAGDGVTDDSTKWNTFVETCMTLGLRGIIRPGHYRIPGATAVSVTGKLTLMGDGSGEKPILDGEKTAANALLRLVDKGLVIQDIVFKDFVDIVTAGNGASSALPNTVTGDIDEVSFRGVEFDNCRRPLFAFVSKTGPTLSKFRFLGCVIDGKTTGWCGCFWGWTNMVSAKADRNEVRNIDATAAGYGSGGSGSPAQVGNGRAILLGGNNPAEGYTWKNWSADDNFIENITDSRAKQAGVNPEVGAIRMTGVSYSSICRNKIFNVRSTGTGVDDDCEAIYPKIKYAIIADNTLTDCGINGSAIVLKGYNRAGDGLAAESSNPAAYGYGGKCCGNRIVNTTGLSAGGISNYSSDWTIDDNHIEGCGGLPVDLGGGNLLDRFVPLWSNAAQADNIEITNNRIVNAIGQFGILDTGYGINHKIENNTIDGVLASIAGLPAQRTIGIALSNADGNGFNTGDLPLAKPSIRGNRVGRLVAVSGQTTAVFSLNTSGSVTTGVRIEGNTATTATEIGVWISGGVIEGLAINDNDWALCNDDYLQTGSPTLSDWAARGNNGWLYGAINVNVPSLAAGATQAVGTVTVNDARTQDRVFVSSGSDVQGTFLWGAVTANDTVTIYQFNPTAGAIDVINSNYRVRVEKFVG